MVGEKSVTASSEGSSGMADREVHLRNIKMRSRIVASSGSNSKKINSLDGVFKERLALITDRTRYRGFPAVAMMCGPDWLAPTGRRPLRGTPFEGIAGWSR